MVLGCCGFHGDVLTVTKNLTTQLKVHIFSSHHDNTLLTRMLPAPALPQIYEHTHHKKMRYHVTHQCTVTVY